MRLTHSTSLPSFIAKKDIGYTQGDKLFLYRYILQQVADITHGDA